MQGSILGPILYAIYISPLFDLLDLTAFADDIQTLKYFDSIVQLVATVESDLDIIRFRVNETFNAIKCENDYSTKIKPCPSLNLWQKG